MSDAQRAANTKSLHGSGARWSGEIVPSINVENLKGAHQEVIVVELKK